MIKFSEVFGLSLRVVLIRTIVSGLLFVLPKTFGLPGIFTSSLLGFVVVCLLSILFFSFFGWVKDQILGANYPLGKAKVRFDLLSVTLIILFGVFMLRYFGIITSFSAAIYVFVIVSFIEFLYLFKFEESLFILLAYFINRQSMGSVSA